MGVGDMSDNYVTLRICKDGGHDFLAPTVHSLGDVGAFQTEVIRRRMGVARWACLEISISSPIKRDLIAVEAMISHEG